MTTAPRNVLLATLTLVVGMLPLALVSAHECTSLTREPPSQPGNPDSGCDGGWCPCLNADHDHTNTLEFRQCVKHREDCVAEERHPKCDSDQPRAGYATTESVWSAWDSAGEPGNARACEGEHWDGNDPVRPDRPGNCNGEVDVSSGAFAGRCLEADPNTGAGDDPLSPAGFRAATDGNAAYGAANVAFVGRAAVYVDGNTVAVYYRDNTPGNVAWTLVSAAGVEKGHVAESDCDQATYQQGAMSNDRTLCGRDNTALTVQHGLA